MRELEDSRSEGEKKSGWKHDENCCCCCVVTLINCIAEVEIKSERTEIVFVTARKFSVKLLER